MEDFGADEGVFRGRKPSKMGISPRSRHASNVSESRTVQEASGV